MPDDQHRSEHSVTRLAKELQAGDTRQRDEAARLLWGRYARGLLGGVRVRMDEFVRSQTSPDSVVQEAFQEVFGRLQSGEAEVADRNGLLSLLRTAARRRLIDKARHVKAAKRNPRQNDWPPAADETPDLEAAKPVRRPEPVRRGYRQPLPTDHLAREPDGDDLSPLDALLVDAPPHVQAAAREVFDTLDEQLKLTFVLWIQQYTADEIAAALGVEPPHVTLLVEVIGERWSKLLTDEESQP